MSVSKCLTESTKTDVTTSASSISSEKSYLSETTPSSLNDVDNTPPPDSSWGIKLEYKAHHVKVSKLEFMRGEIDVVGDECLLALQERGRTVDAFLASLGAVKPEEDSDIRIQTFLNEVYTVPTYVDWKRIEQGQHVFLTYPGPAAFGLLYFSLVGGFSAPKIVKVLDATSYMTTSNYDATWRRLNETMEMVLDCLEEPRGLDVGQPGWKSVLRVRLLHSRVRLGIMKRGHWDAVTNGMPINQEDMVATLLSFSANILKTIQRMTGRLTPADYDAYLHLWRYVGYLIGVQDEYNPCTNMDRAGGTMESIVLHLLTPDGRSGEVARNVLHSVTGRDLMKWSYLMHTEFARLILGHPLSNALGLETSYLHRFYAYGLWGLVYILSNVLAPLTSSKSIAAVKRGLRRKVNEALKPSKIAPTGSSSTTSTSIVLTPTSHVPRSVAIAKEIKELKAEMSAIRIERYTLQ